MSISFPLYFIIFISICSKASSKSIQSRSRTKYILSANEPKRETFCRKEYCDYICLATQCGKQYIKMKPKPSSVKEDWNRVINVHCTDQFSCMGQINIDGGKGHHLHLAELFCDEPDTDDSCHGASFTFIHMKNAHLIGDVRESDILFKDLQQAVIFIEATENEATEQFFLNDVFTKNVKKCNIIADAPYSAVGSVFDLRGITEEIEIQCKGVGSCSGSLFIINRCYSQSDRWGTTSMVQIVCGPGACNAISIWIVEEKNNNCGSLEKVPDIEPFVAVIAYKTSAHSDEESTKSSSDSEDEDGENFVETWTQKHVFVMSEPPNPKEEKDRGYMKQVIMIAQGLKNLFDEENKKPFLFYHSNSKQKWLKQIQSHLQRLGKDYDNMDKTSTEESSWIRSVQGRECYGAVMMESMVQKIAIGAASDVRGMVSNTDVFGGEFVTSIADLETPLIIPGIALVGSGLFQHWISKDGIGIPDSKLNIIKTMKDDVFTDDNDLEEVAVETAKQSLYNEFDEDQMYRTNWFEVDSDGSMVKYDLLTHERYYAKVNELVESVNVNDLQVVYDDEFNSDLFVHEPPHEDVMTVEYLCVMLITSCCLWVIVTFCCGGFCGFMLSRKYGEYYGKRIKTKPAFKV